MERTIETDATQDRELPEPPRRRLTIGDIMGLIIATASTLALLRTANAYKLFAIRPTSPLGVQLVMTLPVAIGCLLIPLTLALLILGIIDKQTPRRNVVQSTGFVTCVAVALSAILPALHYLKLVIMSFDISSHMPMEGIFHNMFLDQYSEAGPMVLGAWIALALTGRWRVGPSWLDRAGCSIGVIFMILYLYCRIWNIYFY
jgi:hypothetical protein